MQTATLRAKSPADDEALVDLLTRVHARDGYPLHGPARPGGPALRRSRAAPFRTGRMLLRHAAAQAPLLGRRAVLDVGQTLPSAIALYDSEGGERVGELHLPLDPETTLDLWVYVSPAP